MVLPSRTPPDPALVVRDIDPAWAERLGAEAAEFNRTERRFAARRAVFAVLGAFAVVVLGLGLFRFETDTRRGPAIDPRSPVWVTVSPASPRD